jgi:hypothetical protein
LRKLPATATAPAGEPLHRKARVALEEFEEVVQRHRPADEMAH